MEVNTGEFAGHAKKHKKDLSPFRRQTGVNTYGTVAEDD